MCEHKTYRCTDGVYYCLLCGATIDNPYKVDKSIKGEEKPVKTAKKAPKKKGE